MPPGNACPVPITVSPVQAFPPTAPPAKQDILPVTLIQVNASTPVPQVRLRTLLMAVHATLLSAQPVYYRSTHALPVNLP